MGDYNGRCAALVNADTEECVQEPSPDALETVFLEQPHSRDVRETFRNSNPLFT